ncbi:MAG: CPBP family intramembrane metalloprotease [Hyphomicrobiales bacterium]|nr:CPBP family intramembrane metalloprotease [Hyphomicrobiales bacterium]
MNDEAATLREGRPLWALAGLGVTLAGPFFLSSEPAQNFYKLAGSDHGAVFLGQLCFTLTLVAALLCLTLGEKLPLASVGLVRPQLRSVLTGIAIGGGVFAVLFGAAVVLSHFGKFDTRQAAAVVLDWPLWLKIYAVVTAGVVEEAIYRGYAISRLTALTGRRWLAAALSLAAFVVAHLPFWGVGAIATPLIGGAFFTIVYLWRRDLIAVMSAHVMVDFVGLILAPMLGAH